MCCLYKILEVINCSVKHGKGLLFSFSFYILETWTVPMYHWNICTFKIQNSGKELSSKTAFVDLFTPWKSKHLWPVLHLLMDRCNHTMTLLRNLYLWTSDLISQCSLMYFSVQIKLVAHIFLAHSLAFLHLPFCRHCPCLRWPPFYAHYCIPVFH